MKKLSSRLSAGILILVISMFFWPPLGSAAEAAPPAPGSWGAGGFILWLSLAVVAGVALGAWAAWMLLQRYGRKVCEQKPLTDSLAIASPNLNAANAMTVGFIHEFNNILCSIQGFTDLALLRIGANGPNRQGLEQIRIGTERVTELLGQLEHFHMEASASQPVTLGLVLKGYGKSLAFEPALAKVTESGQIRPTVLVQVRDTNIQVLARPTQVQDLLVALHRVACGVSTDVEDNCRPQLVLQQASTEGDENDRTPPRLELLLQGLGTLPEGSEAELGQLAEALGGVMSVRRPADNCISYRVSLPGLYPVLPIPSNRQLNT